MQGIRAGKIRVWDGRRATWRAITPDDQNRARFTRGYTDGAHDCQANGYTDAKARADKIEAGWLDNVYRLGYYAGMYDVYMNYTGNDCALSTSWNSGAVKSWHCTEPIKVSAYELPKGVA